MCLPVARLFVLLLSVGTVSGCSAPIASDTNITQPASRDWANYVLDCVRVPGFRVPQTIVIRSGSIVSIEPAPREKLNSDCSGETIVPQVIDSHVHFSVLPQASEHAGGGVGATVDLGAPIENVRRSNRSRMSGPLLTAPAGYPTQSWGRDGFGFQIADPSQASSAIDNLAEAGASVVKVALAGERGLRGESLRAVVSHAHKRGLKVVGHALGTEDVIAAADAGVDVLAHVPLEPLDAEAIAAWAPRPVITTLAAFSPERAIRNLSLLRAAGSPVFYGTDLGNTRDVGISEAEIAMMSSAGMSGAEIIDSATRLPAKFWQFPIGQPIEVGSPACIMGVDGDPEVEPTVLAKPLWVSDCEA